MTNPEEQTMNPITDHFDGFDLNDRLTIARDPRNPDAGNASHAAYELKLAIAPQGSWFNANAPCGSCDEEGGLQYSGHWIRCTRCGRVWDPEGDRIDRAAQDVLGKNLPHQAPE